MMLWTINGIAFYVLMFATGQWLRLVPVTWGVFPAALSTALQYASLNFPVDESWTRYNGLQQLSYFITVFVAAPVSILTGLMQSPAISNRLGLLGTVLNRQAARSIHFISFCWFVLFILAHGIMVFVTGLRQNTNHMFAGVESHSWAGFPLFVLAMVLVGLAWWVASPFTIRHARLVQRTGQFMVGWIKGLSEWWEPNAQLTEKDISPHFWPNGTMPNSAEFEALVADEFAHYRLRVGGLVETPREFSFADLKAMPKQEQITTHFCIQGWSGVAKWGGVPMRDILDIVKPTADARYAVFYSFSEGSAGGGYYDVHEIAQHAPPADHPRLRDERGAASACCTARRCGCAARTSWASRWSSGSRRSSSCTTSPTLAPARAAITRIMSSMDIVCRFEARKRGARHLPRLSKSSPAVHRVYNL